VGHLEEESRRVFDRVVGIERIDLQVLDDILGLRRIAGQPPEITQQKRALFKVSLQQDRF
jgi:hypothetical protein